jgi:hypothetical protein
MPGVHLRVLAQAFPIPFRSLVIGVRAQVTVDHARMRAQGLRANIVPIAELTFC